MNNKQKQKAIKNPIGGDYWESYGNKIIILRATKKIVFIKTLSEKGPEMRYKKSIEDYIQEAKNTFLECFYPKERKAK